MGLGPTHIPFFHYVRIYWYTVWYHYKVQDRGHDWGLLPGQLIFWDVGHPFLHLCTCSIYFILVMIPFIQECIQFRFLSFYASNVNTVMYIHELLTYIDLKKVISCDLSKNVYFLFISTFCLSNLLSISFSLSLVSSFWPLFTTC